ncbi:hypothetical protein L1987_79594 [Smallanthus sonchifolius]|uniref:Uncharacterized protein n=1 Tax=Smallanthus sonchifolius TaxID=185202 RepID=A0ACB8YKB9_9ASTR|nr:hypothetical protein L1987_79594 [Smallanthus sonchifolius]
MCYFKKEQALQVKSNILRFSGFVWPENEKCEVSDGRVDHWVEVISNNGKCFSQKENVDILSKTSTEDLGSSNGNSVVTYVLYKSLLHWKVFEAERSDVFDQCLVLQYKDHQLQRGRGGRGRGMERSRLASSRSFELKNNFSFFS